MSIIKLSPLLMITALACTACSDSASDTQPLNDSQNVQPDSVYAEFVGFRSGSAQSTSADITITNNTDYTADYLRCDSYGYLGDALVATMEDQRMFSTPNTDFDLQPGQTKAAKLIFSDNPENTIIDRVEWVCSYQEGRDFDQVIFEGGS